MKLTSIKLSLTGAHAWAVVNGPLTSGMVGIPVTIEYDTVWEGLTKNLVCRCSPWNSDSGESRTILNVEETAVVAHEVMQAGQYLHLGLEGFREDGTLVIPTTWAKCGKIEYGANSCDDPSADPELPIWNQLQTEMEQIRQDVVTPELMAEIVGYAQTAGQAAVTAEQSAQNAAAAAERAEAAADSETYGTLSAAQINALDGMFKVTAYDSNADYAGAYAAFCTAFDLSAPENGGDSGGDDSGGDDSGGSGGEDSGGGDSGESNESAWTDGVAYEWENISDEYVERADGSFVAYAGWSRTPYMACSGAGILRAEVVTQSASMSRDNSSYNVFYDADRQFISSFCTVAADAPEVGTYTDIEIPANAAYFIVSHKNNVMGETSGTPYIRFIPYREVPV